MCLATLDGETKSTEGGRGYKVFRRDGSRIVGAYHGRFKSYTLGKEYVTVGEVRSLPPLTYPLGFHIFLTKGDAVEWCKVHSGAGVWRVQFSDVVASGEDSCRHLPVIVAQKMTILRKVASG